MSSELCGLGGSWYDDPEATFTDIDDADLTPMESVLGAIFTATAGVDMDQYTAICFQGGLLTEAMANGIRQPCVGLAVTEATEGILLRVRNSGSITNSSWSWTPGLRVYLSDSVMGGLTQTPPASNEQLLGIALSATEIYLYGNIRIKSETTATSTSTTTTTSTSSTTTTTTAP